MILTYMNKLLYTFLGSILILASCYGRGQKPEHSQNGRPEDKYACTITLQVIAYLLGHHMILALKMVLTTS